MTGDFDFLESLLRRRHSCRAFAPGCPDPGDLERLARAFAAAPSAGGDRGVRCAFITDGAVIRGMAEKGAAAFEVYCDRMESPIVREGVRRYGKHFFWFGAAPVLAVVSYRKPPSFMAAAGNDAESLWGGEASAAMAVFALLLAAESLRLGACCLTGPLAVRTVIEPLLDLPQRERLAMLVALGRPHEV